MEGLFRGKDLSASPAVLRRHQRATTGRTNCVIYGIWYQMKMWAPGWGQGSHSWLTGDPPKGFQLPSCLPNPPWQWGVAGRDTACPALRHCRLTTWPGSPRSCACPYTPATPCHPVITPGVRGQQWRNGVRCQAGSRLVLDRERPHTQHMLCCPISLRPQSTHSKIKLRISKQGLQITKPQA